MRNVFTRGWSWITQDDLFISAIKFVAGALLVVVSLLALVKGVPALQAPEDVWVLAVLCVIASLSLAWGAFLTVSSFQPSSSKWRKRAESFIPDGVGFEGVLFAFVLLVPAVILTCVLRVSGVKGSRN